MITFLHKKDKSDTQYKVYEDENCRKNIYNNLMTNGQHYTWKRPSLLSSSWLAGLMLHDGHRE